MADAPLLEPGRNCWRIEHANRASVVIDAADYFAVVRQAMLNAQHQILLIGWDFDTRIRLGRGGDRKAGPNKLGDFILWLVKRRPSLNVYILKWDLGALKMLTRGSTLLTVARWAMQDRITFKLDGAHPTGASHHQKIVVIDDSFAFCGGIDMTADRWDTREHLDDHSDRIRPGGGPYGPWHDVTMAVDDRAARALAELGRSRWKLASGEEIPPCPEGNDPWPDALEPSFTKVELGIARTRADYEGCEEVREIETLYLDLLARAKRFIYAENQYFASRKIAEAIAKRMGEPDPPEIVLVSPRTADGWLEQVAMDSARARLWQAIERVDAKKRFRIYLPQTAAGEAIYVHAKVMIVDDEVLRIGSSNMNNRSLGLDSECDLLIDAAGRPEQGATIARIRTGLMAEHLGVAPEELAAEVERCGSLIGAIELLRGAGHTLDPYAPPELTAAEVAIADNEVLDPEKPQDMFEPFAKRRGLFRRRLRPPPLSPSAG